MPTSLVLLPRNPVFPSLSHTPLGLPLWWVVVRPELGSTSAPLPPLATASFVKSQCFITFNVLDSACFMQHALFIVNWFKKISEDHALVPSSHLSVPCPTSAISVWGHGCPGTLPPSPAGPQPGRRVQAPSPRTLPSASLHFPLGGPLLLVVLLLVAVGYLRPSRSCRCPVGSG